MNPRLVFGLLVAVALVSCGWQHEPAAGAAPEQVADEPQATAEAKADKTPAFKADVQPILAKSCAGCHGAGRRRANVDIRTYDSVLKIVQASEPDKSRLVKAVTGKGEKLMPPRNGLPEAQVKVIKEWIAAGAKND